MCEGPDGFVQAGIVSWGVACGLPDVPGGYVNIGMYVCWIKRTVEKVSRIVLFTCLFNNFRLKVPIIFLMLMSAL